jgi:hypothetical protein
MINALSVSKFVARAEAFCPDWLELAISLQMLRAPQPIAAFFSPFSLTHGLCHSRTADSTIARSRIFARKLLQIAASA